MRRESLIIFALLLITINTLDRYRRQLEVYAHLVEERTGHKYLL